MCRNDLPLFMYYWLLELDLHVDKGHRFYDLNVLKQMTQSLFLKLRALVISFCI